MRFDSWTDCLLQNMGSVFGLHFESLFLLDLSYLANQVARPFWSQKVSMRSGAFWPKLISVVFRDKLIALDGCGIDHD